MNLPDASSIDPQTPSGKTARLEVRLVQKEYETVKTKAQQAGLSVSEYARRCVLDRPITAALSAEQRRAVVGLSDNLNQAMKRAHQAGQYTEELDQMIQQVRNFLTQ